MSTDWPPVTAPGSGQVLSHGTDAYGRKVLLEEADRVRQSPVGSRNTTLNKAGFAVYQLVAGGRIDRADVTPTLLPAALAAGLGDLEARRTLASAERSGMANPRYPTANPPRTAASLPTSTNLPLGPSGASTGSLERFLLRGQLADLPRPDPLIDGTLDRRTVALLVGAWGTCKTFLALSLAASVATGQPWHGRAANPGVVIYIAAEGAYGLHDRLAAWEQANRKTIEDLHLWVLDRPVNLTRQADVDQLCADISRLGCISLVVIDTVARCTVGADENSARDMGIVVDNLTRIRDATDGGTVLAVHHTGKDNMTTRGSSALESGVDTIYRTAGDSRLFQLTRAKRKDGPVDDQLRLTLRPHGPSCVIAAAGHYDQAVTDPATAALKPAARQVLDVLDRDPASVTVIGDRLANTRRPLRRRTIQEALAALADAGLADSLDGGQRGAKDWLLTTDGDTT